MSGRKLAKAKSVGEAQISIWIRSEAVTIKKGQSRG